MPEEKLTIKQFAARIGAAAITVRGWCRAGKLPGAQLEETPFGRIWFIPEHLTKTVKVRPRGRPPHKER